MTCSALNLETSGTVGRLVSGIRLGALSTTILGEWSTSPLVKFNINWETWIFTLSKALSNSWELETEASLPTEDASWVMSLDKSWSWSWKKLSYSHKKGKSREYLKKKHYKKITSASILSGRVEKLGMSSREMGS